MGLVVGKSCTLCTSVRLPVSSQINNGMSHKTGQYIHRGKVISGMSQVKLSMVEIWPTKCCSKQLNHSVDVNSLTNDIHKERCAITSSTIKV